MKVLGHPGHLGVEKKLTGLVLVILKRFHLLVFKVMRSSPLATI